MLLLGVAVTVAVDLWPVGVAVVLGLAIGPSASPVFRRAFGIVCAVLTCGGVAYFGWAFSEAEGLRAEVATFGGMLACLVATGANISWGVEKSESML